MTPLFKKGDYVLMDNYRPISVIIRLCSYYTNRLYSFFSENNILHKKQFGFQKQHSADHAIVYLVNEILKSLENNCYTLGVFIDLTKTFDTVDHNILLKKLFHYGVRIIP